MSSLRGAVSSASAVILVEEDEERIVVLIRVLIRSPDFRIAGR